MQKGKIFTNEVPDLFKFKFEVFEEMSKIFDTSGPKDRKFQNS